MKFLLFGTESFVIDAILGSLNFVQRTHALHHKDF